jgi:hypothetical protein
MPELSDTSYINSSEYPKLEDKIKHLHEVLDDMTNKVAISRELRYIDIDVEGEREAGQLQPDEVNIPLHIIDTNIRREQSAYVQYITQSPRAIILQDEDDDAVDLAPLEKDLTKKLRFDGWQIPMFACIDSFQANGYGVLEVVQDLSNPGEVGYEHVEYGNFAFTTDTQNIQAVEMTGRKVFFTKTALLALCGDGTKPEHWKREQVDKVISAQPDSTPKDQAADGKERSLYAVIKVMFKVSGMVMVAWAAPEVCDDWLRDPRPLFLGRRKMRQPTMMESLALRTGMMKQPPSDEAYETEFPYVVFPYLISENATISELKGRVFLDQDLQEATRSLMSSIVTKARRSAGLYFSKDVSDPNDDLLMQKNIFMKSGCLINAKIQAFELAAPDSTLLNSVQALMTANQQETSQVNFAVNNRKDSRKTAKEVDTAQQEQQRLSTVQVVLFAIALTQTYRLMVDIIKSRVAAGLIVIQNPTIAQMYQHRFSVKPSGDVDVIEKQQLIGAMMNSWAVVQNTAAGPVFMMDLLELLFPDRASKYVQAIQQQLQQQQSAQAQQQQAMMNTMMQIASGVVNLSHHKDFFSEVGQLHAFPVVQQAAQQIEQMQKQLTAGKN